MVTGDFFILPSNVSLQKWLETKSLLKLQHLLSTAKLGDNVLGSVHLSVCPSVSALTAESVHGVCLVFRVITRMWSIGF